MKTVFVLMLLVLSSPLYAGEPKVYTNQDLEKYGKESAYDEETVLRMGSELRRWEEQKQIEERLIREETAREQRETAQRRVRERGQPEVSGETPDESKPSDVKTVKKKKKT